MGSVLVGQSVAFLLVALFVARYLYPSIKQQLGARRQAIKAALGDVDSRLATAQAAKAQAAEILKEGRVQADSIIRSAQQTALFIEEESKAQARLEQEKIWNQLQAELSDSLLAAKMHVQRELSRVAVQGATLIAEAESSKSHHEQAFELIVKSLGEGRTVH